MRTTNRLSLALALSLAAATVSAEPFPGLTTYVLHRGFKVHADPALVTFIAPSATLASADGEETVLMKIRPSKGAKPVEIHYTDGPSCDPELVVCPEGDLYGSSQTGREIYVPGNGFVYTRGRSGSPFAPMRKYSLDGECLVEVPQPVYYIGARTKILADATIRLSPDDGSPAVANLAEGSEVFVIGMADPEASLGWVLVSTPAELCGWYKIEMHSGEVNTIYTTLEGYVLIGD